MFNKEESFYLFYISLRAHLESRWILLFLLITITIVIVGEYRVRVVSIVLSFTVYCDADTYRI